MNSDELNNLDGEYLELWNKFSDESKQLIIDNSTMFKTLNNSKNIIEKFNKIVYEYELYEDDETGNLYNEDDDIVFSMDDYWNTNADNMVDFIYAYELKRGIKL